MFSELGAVIDALEQWRSIAIDGKTLRQSYNTADDKAAIHSVSTWATANRLVLGQRKVDAKSNEITASPQLIKLLELDGCIVPIDAMGCQKQIAKQIIERNADYVLALKDIDKGHGRIETRRCWTMGQLEFLVHADQWDKFTSIGMIQSERRFQGKTNPKHATTSAVCPVMLNSCLYPSALMGWWKTRCIGS